MGKISIDHYVKQLINLVELEKKAEINAMLREIKYFSPQKREKVGRAINHLNGKITGQELGFNLVKYGRKSQFKTEINTGDLVLISRGDPVKSKLTGTVTEKGSRFIIVALEKVPLWALKEIRIDLYVNDITFRRMIENLEKLNPHTKKALQFFLNNEKSHSIKVAKASTSAADIDKNLNHSQKIAICMAMASNDFFLIHGPFGTGKTRTLQEIIVQEIKKCNKVLATAESNTAVDNLVEGLGEDINSVRLGHPQRVSRKNIEKTLAYKLENHPQHSKIRGIEKEIEKIIAKRDQNHKPSPALRRGLSDTRILLNAVKRRGVRGISPNVIISMARWIELNKKVEDYHLNIRKIESHMVADIIKKSEVVLCTNSSAALDYLKGIKFQVVVVDEASQSTIPSILIPLSKARRFILAGDHRQLPPTILNPQCKPLEKTLFEKLIRIYPEKSHMLNIQYRMNPVLMQFPNQEFYEKGIKASGKVEKINIADLELKNPDENTAINKKFETLIKKILRPQPLLFLDTLNLPHHYEKRSKGSTSIKNIIEADITTIISNMMIKSGIKSEDIGIISPYDDQVKLINPHTPAEVHTVDGFQGREKEIIIISLVRSNPKREIGFLKDLRRLNVSLTRAKRKLIIIGDSSTLCSHPTYTRFVDYLKKHDFYENAPDLISLNNKKFEK